MAGVKAEAEQRRVAAIIAGLGREYAEAECALRHENAFQLLIATILSAQCTDERVNLVTKPLFAKYPAAEDLARVPLATLEKEIQSTGFFRNKAKNIQGCCRRLVSEHGGEVPRDLEALVELPGVGRKTANVVLNTAFGEPTIAVDTHIFRVANRTGLGPGKTPLAVELKLIKSVPEQYRRDAHHWLILHGRYVCTARRPQCERCRIADLCEFKGKAVS